MGLIKFPNSLYNLEFLKINTKTRTKQTVYKQVNPRNNLGNQNAQFVDRPVEEGAKIGKTHHYACDTIDTRNSICGCRIIIIEFVAVDSQIVIRL